MSIHLVGRNYSLVPEGGAASLIEIQNELAIQQCAKGRFSRLVWIPGGLEVQDARQQKVIETLRMDPRIHEGSDLLETCFEDLKTAIERALQWVTTPEPSPAPPAGPVVSGCPPRVYITYDQRDVDAIAPWADFLFNQGLEVAHPVLEGDEAEIREYHEDNLRTCDAAVIFYGAANECWLRRKWNEVQKSPGYGRTTPAPPVAICLLPPRRPDKERFKSHEALVIAQWDGLAPDPWRTFIATLTG